VSLFDSQNTMKRYFLVVANTQKVFYLMEQVGEEFVARGELALPLQPNSNVTQVTVNDKYTKLLINCSDRFLRLYQIHYPSSSQDKARFELLDAFQDVINHNRWLHCQFLRLTD